MHLEPKTRSIRFVLMAFVAPKYSFHSVHSVFGRSNDATPLAASHVCLFTCFHKVDNIRSELTPGKDALAILR